MLQCSTLRSTVGNPLLYSCLGNPMDRGAWQATAHGVAKESDITQQLKQQQIILKPKEQQKKLDEKQRSLKIRCTANSPRLKRKKGCVYVNLCRNQGKLWHHQFGGHEFEQALGVGDGQKSLACYNSWGCKELDMTEQIN